MITATELDPLARILLWLKTRSTTRILTILPITDKLIQIKIILSWKNLKLKRSAEGKEYRHRLVKSHLRIK
jgi:hypothetical protein